MMAGACGERRWALAASRLCRSRTSNCSAASAILALAADETRHASGQCDSKSKVSVKSRSQLTTYIRVTARSARVTRVSDCVTRLPRMTNRSGVLDLKTAFESTPAPLTEAACPLSRSALRDRYTCQECPLHRAHQRRCPRAVRTRESRARARARATLLLIAFAREPLLRRWRAAREACIVRRTPFAAASRPRAVEVTRSPRAPCSAPPDSCAPRLARSPSRTARPRPRTVLARRRAPARRASSRKAACRRTRRRPVPRATGRPNRRWASSRPAVRALPRPPRLFYAPSPSRARARVARSAHAAARAASRAPAGKLSSPSYGFGTSVRFGLDSPRGSDASSSPSASPAALSPRGALPGGRSARASAPGPGSYALPSSFGRQADARRLSPPNAAFGTSERDDAAKLYLGPEGERLQAGRHSPGPATATLPGSFLKQAEAKARSAPAWGFGSSSQRGTAAEAAALRNAAATPGPQHYATIAFAAGGSAGRGAGRPAPLFTFPRASREEVSRMWVSSEHARARSGARSARAVACARASRCPLAPRDVGGGGGGGAAGVTAADRAATRAAAVYVTAPRVRARAHIRAAGLAGPGPAGYAPAESAVGRQLSSTRPSSRACSFGSADRFAAYGRAAVGVDATPGPGYYNA